MSSEEFKTSKTFWVNTMKQYLENIDIHRGSKQKIQEIKDMLIFMSSDMYWKTNYVNSLFLDVVKKKIVSFLRDDQPTAEDKFFFQKILEDFDMVRYCNSYTLNGNRCKNIIKGDIKYCKLHEKRIKETNKKILDNTILYPVLTNIIVKYIL